MPIDQRIKDRAHQIDPECWKSYSGRGISFKRQMEHRRQRALDIASKELKDRIEDEDSVENTYRRYYSIGLTGRTPSAARKAALLWTIDDISGEAAIKDFLKILVEQSFGE